MRILVTGACGFVGSIIARAFCTEMENMEVHGIDNFSRTGSWVNIEANRAVGVRMIHGDLRCEEDLAGLPRFDAVVDAAANPSVLAGIDGQTSSRQLMSHNLLGTLNLLESCRRHASTFILLSTSRVYSIAALSKIRTSQFSAEGPNGFRWERFEPAGAFPEGFSREGIRESFSTEPPLSLYGCSKRASELLALEYAEQFGFPVWINRCGVLAGAGQFGHPGQGIVAYWIHAHREGRPLTYIGFDGSGRQVRDVLHPQDLMDILFNQVRANEVAPTRPRVVNLGGGPANSFSLVELTRWCRERFPATETPIPASEKENRPYDLPWVVMDATLARQNWFWKPQTQLHAIFEEIAKFAEKDKHWLDRIQY